MRLYDLSKRIELSVKEGNLDDFSEKFNELIKEFEYFTHHYSKL